MNRRLIPSVAALGLALGACSDGGTGPAEVICEPVTLTLGLFEATTARGSDLTSCLTLTGENALYWVIPQFATEAAGRPNTTFEIGPTAAAAAALQPSAAFTMASGSNLAQLEFDRALRMREHEMAPAAVELSRARAANRGLALDVAAAPPTLGSTREFSTLTTLETPATFGTTTATLKYIGTHIYLYVDNAAPANGFSDAELNSFGDLFDKRLYDLDTQLFAAESDIDQNGHLIMLLTSAVNKLTPRADCGTKGFVTGYFFGWDLSSTASTSNKGEVFYALVPDPTADLSCAHTVADVERIVPGTFVHEFQHMISYNQHVLVGHGQDEATWLNEGLSLIAEENAAVFYEALYPAPLQRSTPGQLFPDSAEAFILPNLVDAYNYLSAPTVHSITTFDQFGTLQERGGAWLFLRWLGDQKGRSIYASLVKTTARSVDNVEQKAGEPFGQLFADFGIATLADSVPGYPQSAVPSRYRFAPERNLRRIFAWMRSTNRVPTSFPIFPKGASTALATSAMLPGTMDFFRVQTPTPGSPFTLRFAPQGGGAFPANLEAQVAVFRYQ